jgi:hypothetical protein
MSMKGPINAVCLSPINVFEPGYRFSRNLVQTIYRWRPSFPRAFYCFLNS